MATSRRPAVASLSLDLDNLWSYLMTHGEPGWQSFPSYFSSLIPRVLDFLGKRALRITFFVVGQDAVREENRDLLRAIVRSGHEIANHSFHHLPWLSSLPTGEIEAEIVRAEEAIQAVTGLCPLGFRAPGYSGSVGVCEILARRGYLYDASSLPTFLGPLARAYYFRGLRLAPQERERRKKLFGRWRDGFEPLRPYLIDWNGPRILEIPVTTFPGLRIPIHVSYVLYLARFSRRLALGYVDAAVRLCRISAVEPSLLLHSLDFLGGDEVPELRFFPAMDLTSEQKMEITAEILDRFSATFRCVTLQEHAKRLLEEPCVPVRKVSSQRHTN